MLILKQSTAIDIRMGPFVDATDGVTPETGVTLAGADQAEVLKANGAATAAMAGTFAAVTGADGWYDYTASTTDTNTVGEVIFVVQDSSVCLPVMVRAQVVEEAIYDALFGASATGFDASGAVTTGTISAGAINAAAIGTGAIDADALAADAGTEIAAAVWDRDATLSQTQGTFGQAIGDPVADPSTIWGLANTNLDATITSRLASADINLTGGAVDTVTTVNGLATDSVNASALATDAVNEIVDQVWNEDIADHVAVGTFGEALYINAYAGPNGIGVYIDDGAANTATIAGEDGTVGKPVSTMAAARTIASAIGVKRFYFTGVAAELNIDATSEDWEFIGLGSQTANIIDLNSIDVDGSLFRNLTLQGVQGGTARITAVDCILRDDPGAGTTDLHIQAIRCGILDSIRVTNNDDHIFDGCYSMVAGNGTPTLDLASGANTDVNVRHYSGGIQIDNASATATMSIETDGQVVVDATCNASFDLTVRGNASITDNASLSSLTQDAVYNSTNVGDAVWDEDIVAAHTTADTAGAILSNILPESNAAFSNIPFLWVAASDHVTPVTGATGTSVTRSIDGGAFGSATGTLAEIGNGIYQFDASAADMNGEIITFRFVATGGTPGAPDDAFVTLKTTG